MNPLIQKALTIQHTPMSEIEKSRRNAAMEREVILNPNRPNFPQVTFKVSKLVEHIHKWLPHSLPHTTDCCWLKGSWTNEQEEFPNDVDLGICIADPYFEEQFNGIISLFLLQNANKTGKDQRICQTYKNGLPVSIYFNPISITCPDTTSLAFKTYKSLDLDLTT